MKGKWIKEGVIGRIMKGVAEGKEGVIWEGGKE